MQGTEGDALEEVEAAWDAEIERRIASLNKAVLVSWDAVRSDSSPFPVSDGATLKLFGGDKE